MSDHYKQKIIDAYSNANESRRADLSGEFAMEFNYTKKVILDIKSFDLHMIKFKHAEE